MENTKNKRKSILEVLDFNKNGKVDIEDIIVLAMNLPGVKIKRDDFLKKEFSTKCSKETLDLAIATTPKDAGIDEKIIEKVASEVIKYERNCVSSISAALGVPGGWAMVATVPADLVQFYGYMLRAAQKLLYLYGFQQINVRDNDSGLDTATVNLITICLGVMYGVAGAKNALIAISKALAKGVEKKLLQAALTKGTVYPIVKRVAKWFGIKLTKALFAGAVKKIIPIIGGGLGFLVTFFSFQPCCERLRRNLRDNYLYNKERDNSNDDWIIDGEFEDANSEDDTEGIFDDFEEESPCPTCNTILKYKDVFATKKNVCSCPNCGEKIINPNCGDEYIWYCNKCNDIMNNQDSWHGETGELYKCDKCGATNDLSNPESNEYLEE